MNERVPSHACCHLRSTQAANSIGARLQVVRLARSLFFVVLVFILVFIEELVLPEATPLIVKLDEIGIDLPPRISDAHGFVCESAEARPELVAKLDDLGAVHR